MKALLLIDIQKGLTDRALYKKETFIETVNMAIARVREKDDLIIFVQHENKQLTAETESWEIDDNLNREDADAIFSKQKGDAFSNKDLVAYLKKNEVTDIIVGGLVTHGCIKHTCLGGIKAGFDISLLQEGHSNWARDAKDKIGATEAALKETGVRIIKI